MTLTGSENSLLNRESIKTFRKVDWDAEAEKKIAIAHAKFMKEMEEKKERNR